MGRVQAGLWGALGAAVTVAVAVFVYLVLTLNARVSGIENFLKSAVQQQRQTQTQPEMPPQIKK
jgi:hypothetical protein